jgi:basic amino acid/polyamine antiporter, APA family
VELRAPQLTRDEPRAATRTVAYHRIVVPVIEGPNEEEAVATACKLAGEHGALIAAVSVVEVPPELPLDAHMLDEEASARRILARARAIAELYGLGVETRLVRARAAGEAIVEEARLSSAELIVLTAPRRAVSRQAPVFGRTARAVLEHATCRVLVIGR